MVTLVNGYVFFGMFFLSLGILIIIIGSKLGGALTQYSIGVGIVFCVVGSVLLIKGESVDKQGRKR